MNNCHNGGSIFENFPSKGEIFKNTTAVMTVIH